ncbi:ATP-binding protein [Desulforegula conservatrix]|uniref:ATP-binding protein n=1 Tax=Desulforegula conservatrix TaxID=153026 RepID=UPI0004231BD8|nr:ATP-binding protein [Desulforegula conservatrix]
MKFTKFLLSFRNTIVWLVLLSAIIPVSIISTGLIGKIHRITREAALKEMDILAESVSGNIGHQFDLSVSMLKGLASNRDIALATRKNSLGIGHYLSGRAPAYLEKIIDAFPLVSRIYLTDINGDITVSTDQLSDSFKLNEQIETDIKSLIDSNPKSTGRVVSLSYTDTKNTYSDNDINATFIAIIIPVILDITTEVQGTLIAEIPLSKIKYYAERKVASSAKVEISPFKNEQCKEAFENNGIIERSSLLSIPGADPKGPLRYIVKISEPSSLRFKFVDRALIDLVLFQVAIILVILLIVYVLARRMTFSLLTLNTIVSHYASGDYSYTGKPVAFIELVSIINVLKKMGQRIIEQLSGLKQAEQKYRSIFENINEGIFQASPNGKFLSANPSMASLLGYNSEEDLIVSVSNIATELFTDRDDRRNFFELIELAEKISGFETKMRTKTGDIIWVSMSVHVVKDENNKLIYYEGSIMDTSQNRAAEEEILKLNAELEQRVSQRTLELEKTNRALSDSLVQLRMTHKQLVQSEKMASLGNLVAGIAHEINTPVGIGVTATSFLEKQSEEILSIYRDGKMTRSELEKYIGTVIESSNMILSNLHRAADLISSFKKIAVDQSSEDKRKFHIKAYMDEIIMSLQPKFKRTRHRIVFECPDDLEILSYPGAFSQIFTNLILNSLIHAFTPEETGEISIGVVPKGRTIEIIYQDNGKGMPPEISNMIFDPFFTTNRSEGGTGLGMHITYNLVTQSLKGDIKCDSAIGKGTKFTIRIPFTHNHK